MSDAAGPLPIVVLISGAAATCWRSRAQARAGTMPRRDPRVSSAIAPRPPASPAAAAAGHRDRGAAAAPATRTAPPSIAPWPTRSSAASRALVVLAGFMRILGGEFVARFAGRMLNIHPSLLPAYRGLHTHRRVLAAGEREHGASVHFVTARTRRRPGGHTGAGPGAGRRRRGQPFSASARSRTSHLPGVPAVVRHGPPAVARRRRAARRSATQRSRGARGWRCRGCLRSRRCAAHRPGAGRG